jgi:hypothetical protein
MKASSLVSTTGERVGGRCDPRLAGDARDAG